MTWQPDGWNDDMDEASMDGKRIMFWQEGKKIKMGEWLPPEANWTI